MNLLCDRYKVSGLGFTPGGAVTGFYYDTVSSLSDAKIRAAGYRSSGFRKIPLLRMNRRMIFRTVFRLFQGPDTVLAENLQVVDSFSCAVQGDLFTGGECIFS